MGGNKGGFQGAAETLLSKRFENEKKLDKAGVLQPVQKAVSDTLLSKQLGDPQQQQAQQNIDIGNEQRATVLARTRKLQQRNNKQTLG